MKLTKRDLENVRTLVAAGVDPDVIAFEMKLTLAEVWICQREAGMGPVTYDPSDGRAPFKRIKGTDFTRRSSDGLATLVPAEPINAPSNSLFREARERRLF